MPPSFVIDFLAVLLFDPFAAAVLEDDVDGARAGVDRVFDELLHHRRRTLDDFAGRDLIHELRRQNADRRHQRILTSSGAIVARAMIMARRVGALLAIALMLGLVLLLIYDVYRHHEAGRDLEEPAVVTLGARAA